MGEGTGGLVFAGVFRALPEPYAGRLPYLTTWLASAEFNRDRNLRLQYLAGLQLESNKGADAYSEILGQRRFPSDMFQASPAQLVALYRALGQTKTEP